MCGNSLLPLSRIPIQNNNSLTSFTELSPHNWSNILLYKSQFFIYVNKAKNGVNNFWVFKNPSHENSKCRKSPCRNSFEMCMCRRVPVPKSPCAEKSPCRRVPVLKHAHVEMCTCRKVPVSKHAGAEKSPCRKNPVSKRAHVGISQMPKYFCAEMFRC